jgi:ribonucleoside-diphosphate reductase alpha chain
VVNALVRRQPHGGTFHIEDIQDQVELALMRSASMTSPAPTCSTARSVPPNVRQKQQAVDASAEQPVLHVVDGERRMPLDRDALRTLIQDSLRRPGRRRVGRSTIFDATLTNLYDGVPVDEVRKSAILAARSLIEKDPAYGYVTARLLLHTIRAEVLGEGNVAGRDGHRLRRVLPALHQEGHRSRTARCRSWGSSIWPSWAPRSTPPQRPASSTTSACRRCTTATSCTSDDRRIELPQVFFMRVAMGLAMNEINREARAIEFYSVLSASTS